MNNRLDFYNEVKKYSATLSEEDDYLFVVSHNKKQGDCMISHCGDWELFSVLFSTQNYLNENSDNFNQMKEVVLNTAYNICNNDDELKRKFLKGLCTI